MLVYNSTKNGGSRRIWRDGTDLGSIESTGSLDNKWNFQLLEGDEDKLPKDVPAGSTAVVLDAKKKFVFHEQSKTWIQTEGGE